MLLWWRQESLEPGEADGSAPHMESALLLPPIPFDLPTWAVKGRERGSPTAAHLAFSPSLGRGGVLVDLVPQHDGDNYF